MGIAILLLAALFVLLGVLGDVIRVLVYLGLFVLVVEVILFFWRGITVTGRRRF